MSEIEIFELSNAEYESVEESAEKMLDQNTVKTGTKYTYKLPKNRVVVVEKHDVTKQDQPDQSITAIIDSFDQILKSKLQRILFRSKAEINTKFSLIRSSASSFCNLVADLFRKETSADCSLIVSGSVRSDRIYPENTVFSFGDVYDIYPLDHELCLIRISGEHLLQALENGVSKYPALEGRFPHVSNITFEFDPQLPAGSRVNPHTVTVAGVPLEREKLYKVAMTNYIADGKDGYDPFKQGHHLIDSGSRKPVRDLIIDLFCRPSSLRHTANRRVLPRVLDLQETRRLFEQAFHQRQHLSEGQLPRRNGVGTEASGVEHREHGTQTKGDPADKHY